VAESYDAAFTYTSLGRRVRSAVWERLATVFPQGSRVLELGCGTGEDAVWLASRGVHVTATDASAAMLAVAEEKAARAGVAHHISAAPLDLERAGDAPSFSPFDGAFSNFGALNCLRDRRALAEALSRWVRPGGRVVLVVMGPVCAWEIGWYLAHGRPGKAFRRLRTGIRGHIGAGAMVRVWYPSPGRLRAELEPWFRHRETVAVNVLLPPSYLADLMERQSAAFDRLARLERRIAGRFPSPSLADHYLSEFERR
jgi:SAM-dependent methyltransferase